MSWRICPPGEICKTDGVICHSSVEENNTAVNVNFELPGCVGNFANYELSQQFVPRQVAPVALNEPKAIPRRSTFKFTLSPELFQTNVPLLDQWLEKVQFKGQVYVTIRFRGRIEGETVRHRLTTKLYQCGIEIVGIKQNEGFRFDGFVFNFDSYREEIKMSYALVGKLEDKRLPIIIDRLFKAGVLWEREPTLSEMLPSD
jgi:hypothetical protein